MKGKKTRTRRGQTGPAGLPQLKAMNERTSRLSLTLLFAGASFLIQLSVLLVVAAAAYVLLHTGVLTQSELGAVRVNDLLALMLLMDLVLGAVGTVLLGRVYMRPINRIINMMNRLAAGDFRVRLHFDGRFSEIGAVRELSDSVNTMAEELEKTEVLRSDFVNNFSHEFKTPIVSIAGFAKILKNADLSDADRRQYLDIIEEESLRLADLATKVMQLTKIENQSILTDVRTYNLSEQLRTCFLLLESKWSTKQVDIRPDFKEYEISANEELLQQVWINLLDNAIKFTTFGGTVSAEIDTVTSESGTQALRVTVSNTGSTIPPEEQERIFRKFYQADTSHASMGSGIGLAVAKKIVDLHGGTVTVSSADDLTRFIVTLPGGEAQKSP